MAEAMVQRLLEEEELEFSKETQSEALDALKSWLEENEDTMTCRSDDKFLYGFLRMRNFDIKETKKMLTNFCSCCKAGAKFTSNLDVLESKMNALASSGTMYMSPNRDVYGRMVLIIKVSALDTNIYNHVDLARYLMAQLFMLMDMPHSQLLGYVYVIDFGDITAGHATFWPLWDMILLLKFSMKAIPMRHKEVHVVHLNALIKCLFHVATSVMPSKMRKRITVHNTLEELKAVVSPDLLPLEYGGSMPAMEMCDLWKKKLEESRELVMSMEHRN